jgi:hypothetical protein
LHMKRKLSVVSAEVSMYTHDQPTGSEASVVGFRTRSTLNMLQKSPEYVLVESTPASSVACSRRRPAAAAPTSFTTNSVCSADGCC